MFGLKQIRNNISQLATVQARHQTARMDLAQQIQITIEDFLIELEERQQRQHIQSKPNQTKLPLTTGCCESDIDDD